MKETEETEFISEDFSNRSLHDRRFLGCLFKNCIFSKTGMQNALFSSCRFLNCSINLPKLEGCRFQSAHFKECKITGAEFFVAERRFFSPTFEKSLLYFCNFSGLNLKNSRFQKCQLKECHFTDSNLSGVSFDECNLSGTIFHSCDMKKADFTSAEAYIIDPRTNGIQGARFSLPEAVGLLRGLDIELL